MKLKCPDCGHDMVLKNSKYGYFYGCIKYPTCSSYHEADQCTKMPIGKPIDSETKKWHLKSFKEIDKVWKNNIVPRNEIYEIVDRLFHKSIVDMNIKECKELIEWISNVRKENNGIQSL